MIKQKLKKWIPIMILAVSSIIVCAALFGSKFNIYADDGIQHVSRIIGSFQSITEGQGYPTIFDNFCNKFGYSWNLFYSPITAILPLFFRLFSLSFTMCMKLFIVLVTFLTGFFMYKYIFTLTKNKYIAVFAGVLYIFTPYRLTDMYIRNALAELVSFLFLPMIFQGLYEMIHGEKKNTPMLWIGSAGLLLAHSMLTVYVVIFAVIYLLVHIKEVLKKDIMLTFIKNIAIILLITSYYLVPFIESKMSADYEVFNQEHMVRLDSLIQLKVEPLELIVTKDDRMIYQIGYVTIIGLLLTPFVLKKLNKKYIKTYFTFFVFGMISVIMSLNIFPFENLPSFFTMMQFSFRMLEFSSFFLTVVAGINIGLLILQNNYNYIETLSACALVIILTIPLMNYFAYYTEETNPNTEQLLIDGVQVTENTGRVHAGLASLEYLPTKAFQNRDYLVKRENVPIIINGQAKIADYIKEKTNMRMIIHIKEKTQDISVELPYIYYIGYKIKLKNNNKVYKIDTKESEYGFVQIDIPYIEDGEYEIEVKYTGTMFMNLSKWVSSLTLLGVIITQIRKRNLK